ncbi:hypothetical protein ABW20_dc0104914 [Dactylellina cionopaga]|nr:hypothetical protein ABW20_dc0104914 [Dactylellina cionopaga]
MSATSSQISERIAVLTGAYHEVAAQIDRLANLTAPGTEEARNELAGLIHQSLKEGDSELETLVLQTSTLNPSTDPQAALQSRLHKLQEELKFARTNYRKSLLHSKRTAALNSRKEREALLFSPPTTSPSSPTSPIQSPSESTSSLPINGAQFYRRPYHQTSKNKKDMTQADLLTSASSDVTTALRRTHALMSAELNRSHFAHETLSQSTETLKQLGQSYSSFDNVLQKSKGLITDLVKKNKSDMWYYQMSLYVLVGTVGWLIFRRLLWGPVYLVIWLPLRLVIWTVMMMFRTPQSPLPVERGAAVGDSGGGSGMERRAESVRSEVEKVVESMTASRKVEDHNPNEGAKAPVKKVTLSNGDEVEVPLEVPEGSGQETANHDEL